MVKTYWAMLGVPDEDIRSGILAVCRAGSTIDGSRPSLFERRRRRKPRLGDVVGRLPRVGTAGTLDLMDSENKQKLKNPK
jgi:hypothetical protein